jgi:ABC-type multidrug transport system permease subunit
MMLLATLLRGQAASGSAWAVMMVLGVLGGGLIPSFLMPPWLEAASYASPVRWTLPLVRGAAVAVLHVGGSDAAGGSDCGVGSGLFWSGGGAA